MRIFFNRSVELRILYNPEADDITERQERRHTGHGRHRFLLTTDCNTIWISGKPMGQKTQSVSICLRQSETQVPDPRFFLWLFLRAALWTGDSIV